MDKDTGIPFYKGPLIDNVDDCLPIANLKKCWSEPMPRTMEELYESSFKGEQIQWIMNPNYFTEKDMKDGEEMTKYLTEVAQRYGVVYDTTITSPDEFDDILKRIFRMKRNCMPASFYQLLSNLLVGPDDLNLLHQITYVKVGNNNSQITVDYGVSTYLKDSSDPRNHYLGVFWKLSLYQSLNEGIDDLHFKMVIVSLFGQAPSPSESALFSKVLNSTETSTGISYKLKSEAPISKDAYFGGD